MSTSTLTLRPPHIRLRRETHRAPDAAHSGVSQEDQEGTADAVTALVLLPVLIAGAVWATVHIWQGLLSEAASCGTLDFLRMLGA